MKQKVTIKKNRKVLSRAAFARTLRGRLGHLHWLLVRNPGRTLRAWNNRGRVGGDAREVAGKLTETGLHIADADTLLSAQGVEALRQASALVFDEIRAEADQIRRIQEQGSNSELSKDYMIHLIPLRAPIEADSPFLKLALDPKLLEIVSSYFGMWPKLHQVGAWLNFPTPQEAHHSQLWHRDEEDHKFLKMFIYLEDVGEKNGPFSFIPKTHPFGADSVVIPRHRHHRRIMDDEMAASIPPDRWVNCVGPANTAILADTVGFHRGGKVEEGRRVLITFTYTSGTPRHERPLRVSGNPGWITLPIQKWAL